MSSQEKDAMRAQLREEAYHELLNQPLIQFPLHPDSPIRNAYNNSSSSQFRNGVNEIEVGMDYYLRDTTSMETMLLDAFQTMSEGMILISQIPYSKF